MLSNTFLAGSALSALCALLCPPVSAAQTPPSTEDVQSLARDAYIFTYPLVMMYRTMYLQAIDETSPSYAGGFGEWLHLGMSSPADRDIVTPNNDTPYSYAWVDLRAEPWVLTIPEIGAGRFYTSQWDDLWCYVLDNVGSSKDGNGGTSVLLAPPGWEGALPDGVSRAVEGESQFLGTLTRTQAFGMEDMDNVREIQGRYHLEPLSAYLGEPAPKAAPAIDWLPWQDGDETTVRY